MAMALFQLGGGLQQMVLNMQNMGFFQYLFPFLLSLAIIYGVLRYSLPEAIPKSAAGLIAIVISFFVMLYASWNAQIVTFLANISGYWLMAGTGILFLVILAGLFGIKPDKFYEGKAKWVLLLALVVIAFLIFFGAGAESLLRIPFFMTGSEFWTIIFFIIILAVVFVVLGSEEAAAPAVAPEK